MRLQGIRAGDLVLCDVKGRRFHAEVTTTPDGAELEVRPLLRGITYRRVTSRSVLEHWRKAGRRGAGGPASAGVEAGGAGGAAVVAEAGGAAVVAEAGGAGGAAVVAEDGGAGGAAVVAEDGGAGGAAVVAEDVLFTLG